MAEINARDISRPVAEMTLGGKKYALAFDCNAFRVAEDVYELHYKRPDNFGAIIEQLTAGKLGAVMAVLYGAMVSAGAKLDWDDFSSTFKLTDIPGVQDLLLDRIKAALPETKEGADPRPAAVD